MKTKVLIFPIIFLIFLISELPVSANHGDDPMLYIKVSDIDKAPSACYIDMLVKIPEDDEYYTKDNEPNMAQFGFDTAKLRDYNDDGFVSLSCHIKDNYTNAVLEDKRGFRTSENGFTLTEDGRFDNPKSHLLLGNGYEYKIALFDKDGELIYSSEPFSLSLYGDNKIDWSLRFSADTHELEIPYTSIEAERSKFSFALVIAIVVSAVITLTVITVVIIATAKKTSNKGKRYP